MSWVEILAMGQYGAYVWSAYALAALVLALNAALPLWRRRTLRRQLREHYRLTRNRDETQA